MLFRESIAVAIAYMKETFVILYRIVCRNLKERNASNTVDVTKLIATTNSTRKELYLELNKTSREIKTRKRLIKPCSTTVALSSIYPASDLLLSIITTLLEYLIKRNCVAIATITTTQNTGTSRSKKSLLRICVPLSDLSTTSNTTEMNANEKRIASLEEPTRRETTKVLQTSPISLYVKYTSC